MAVQQFVGLSALLLLMHLPSSSLAQRPLYVTRGDSILLPCPAGAGQQWDRVTWENDKGRFLGAGNSYSLRKVTVLDAGVYTCRKLRFNGQGTVTAVYSVRLIVLPDRNSPRRVPIAPPDSRKNILGSQQRPPWRNPLPPLNPPRLLPPVLPPFLSRTLPPYRPRTLPPYRPRTLPLYRPRTLPPYRPRTLPSYRPRTLPPYRPRTLPPYRPWTLPPYRPWTLPPYRPRTLPPYRPRTLPPYRPRTLPPYRPRTLPPYRPRTLPPYRPRTLPPYRPQPQPLPPYRPCRSSGNRPRISAPYRTQKNGPVSSICLPNLSRGRGNTACLSNEATCQSFRGRCPRRRCISREWLCDGENDCGNGWDEQNCRSEGPCQTLSFSCSIGGRSVPIAYRCDGDKDCDNGSDEIGCVTAALIPNTTANAIQTFTVRAGECLGLQCSARGIPKPLISWSTENNQPQQISKDEIQEECSLENAASSFFVTSTLEVRAPWRRGDRLEFACIVSQGGVRTSFKRYRVLSRW